MEENTMLHASVEEAIRWWIMRGPCGELPAGNGTLLHAMTLENGTGLLSEAQIQNGSIETIRMFWSEPGWQPVEWSAESGRAVHIEAVPEDRGQTVLHPEQCLRWAQEQVPALKTINIEGALGGRNTSKGVCRYYNVVCSCRQNPVLAENSMSICPILAVRILAHNQPLKTCNYETLRWCQEMAGYMPKGAPAGRVWGFLETVFHWYGPYMMPDSADTETMRCLIRSSPFWKSPAISRKIGKAWGGYVLMPASLRGQIAGSLRFLIGPLTGWAFPLLVKRLSRLYPEADLVPKQLQAE